MRVSAHFQSELEDDLLDNGVALFLGGWWRESQIVRIPQSFSHGQGWDENIFLYDIGAANDVDVGVHHLQMLCIHNGGSRKFDSCGFWGGRPMTIWKSSSSASPDTTPFLSLADLVHCRI